MIWVWIGAAALVAVGIYIIKQLRKDDRSSSSGNSGGGSGTPSNKQ